MAAIIIDSTQLVIDLIDQIEISSPRPPLVFIDLEGTNLSRHGSISIMQLLIPPKPVVNLVDVHVLGKQAFETASSRGTTLKSILESAEYAKVFFDVRNDSDALYSLYGTKVQCVIDLQLLEFVTRPVHGRFLKGLSKCISESSVLTWREKQDFQAIKEAGVKLFAPEQGGSYEVFKERPLPSVLSNYCSQDVSIMPRLLMGYATKLKRDLAAQVHQETLQRIQLSQSPDFKGKGPHMAEGPHIVWTRSQVNLEICLPLSIVVGKCLKQYCETAEPVITSDVFTPGGSRKEPMSLIAQLNGLQLNSRGSPDDQVAGRVVVLCSSDDGLDDDDSDSSRDYGACSSDDCGYCGKCNY